MCCDIGKLRERNSLQMANKGLNRAAQRIQRELREIMNDEFSKSGISVEPIEDNFMKLQGKILGPSGTPYEGGIFVLQIEVPDGYPFKPVNVRFLTKIWHPNISSVTGAICINILKQDWVPCISLRTVLISLQALLSAAEPDSPQDAVVARQYKENHELFKITAKHWSQFYARAPESNSEFDRNLMDGGVNDERALGSNAEFESNLVGGGVDDERALGSNAEFESNLVGGGIDDEGSPGSKAEFERILVDGATDDERAPGSNAEFERNIVSGGVDDEESPGSNAEFERNLMDRGVDDERALGSNAEFESNIVDREESEKGEPVSSSSSFWRVAKTIVHFIFR